MYIGIEAEGREKVTENEEREGESNEKKRNKKEERRGEMRKVKKNDSAYLDGRDEGKR